MYMPDVDCKRYAMKILSVVYRTLCFHNNFCTPQDLNKALHMYTTDLQPFSTLSALSAHPDNTNAVKLHPRLFQQLKRTLTSYNARCLIYHAGWNQLLDVEKVSSLVTNLIRSQDTFVRLYVPIQHQAIDLKYRLNKIKPCFRRWRKEYDFQVQLRAKVLSVKNHYRRRALRHCYNMTQKMKR